MSRCTRCRVEVLEVVVAAGYTALLDPAPLDPLGELRAAVAGRPTYTRHERSGLVAWRHPRVVAARPAGSRPRQTVHAAHTCAGAPFPGTMSR